MMKLGLVVNFPATLNGGNLHELYAFSETP